MPALAATLRHGLPAHDIDLVAGTWEFGDGEMPVLVANRGFGTGAAERGARGEKQPLSGGIRPVYFRREKPHLRGGQSAGRPCVLRRRR